MTRRTGSVKSAKNMQMELQGRLERVYITEQSKSKSSNAYGFFGDKKVFVHNAGWHVGEEVVVRFTNPYPEQEIRIPMAAFISSSIPDDLPPYDASNYILIAEWFGNYMGKNGAAPTMTELRHYYDPINLPFAYFLLENSSSSYGRFWIGKEQVNENKGDISDIVNTLKVKLEDSSRLIVTESDDKQIGDVVNEILKAGLYPVVMEPLQ